MEQPTTNLSDGVVIQLITRRLLDMFRLRYDRSFRSARFFGCSKNCWSPTSVQSHDSAWDFWDFIPGMLLICSVQLRWWRKKLICIILMYLYTRIPQRFLYPLYVIRQVEEKLCKAYRLLAISRNPPHFVPKKHASIIDSSTHIYRLLSPICWCCWAW